MAGLLGVDGGLVWLVAGVWTVRAMAGTPLGGAWGVACIAAGFRWGTLSVADIGVATRLNGATLLSGGVAVRSALAVALASALVAEAQVDGVRARTWGERAASLIAVTALVPLFAMPGPADAISLAALGWAGASVLVTAAVVVLGSVAAKIPAWIPAPVAAVATVAASVGS